MSVALFDFYKGRTVKRMELHYNDEVILDRIYITFVCMWLMVGKISESGACAQAEEGELTVTSEQEIHFDVSFCTTSTSFMPVAADGDSIY